MKITRVEPYSYARRSPFGEQIIPKNGDFAVPPGPGLGQDPDLDLVERMRLA